MKRALIAGLILLAGCSGQKDKGAAEPKPSALVSTEVVRTASLPEVLTTYGAAEVTAAGERIVATPLESIVSQVLVAVGDPVRAGQALVQLQPSPTVRLDIAKAARDAQAAQTAYARAVRLRSTGLVSDADVETTRAAVATAQTLSQSLSGRLSGVLNAPIGGIVQTIASAPGDLVAAGAPIMKIGPGTGSRVRLGLDPREASRIHVGEAVRVSPTDGGPGFTGSITALDPRADPQTRLASAFASIPRGLQVSPGQPLKGEITVGRHTGVATVPRSAVLYEGDKPYLFVIEGGVAHRREVTLGVESGDQVEVRSGLKPGERIALNGGTALSDGMAVRQQSGAAARP